MYSLKHGIMTLPQTHYRQLQHYRQPHPRQSLGKWARQKMVCAQQKSAKVGLRSATPEAATSSVQIGSSLAQSFRSRSRISLSQPRAN